MSWLSDTYNNVVKTATNVIKDTSNYVRSVSDDPQIFMDDFEQAAKSAINFRAYIMDNPGHTIHVAGDGIETGLTKGTGFIVGGVTDLTNTGYKWITDGRTLYDGSALDGVSGFLGENVDLISKPEMRNDYDRLVHSLTESVGQGASVIAVTAATAGAVGLTGGLHASAAAATAGAGWAATAKSGMAVRTGFATQDFLPEADHTPVEDKGPVEKEYAMQNTPSATVPTL